jgi:hypothetical protein
MSTTTRSGRLTSAPRLEWIAKSFTSRISCCSTLRLVVVLPALEAADVNSRGVAVRPDAKVDRPAVREVRPPLPLRVVALPAYRSRSPHPFLRPWLWTTFEFLTMDLRKSLLPYPMPILPRVRSGKLLRRRRLLRPVPLQVLPLPFLPRVRSGRLLRPRRLLRPVPLQVLSLPFLAPITFFDKLLPVPAPQGHARTHL